MSLSRSIIRRARTIETAGKALSAASERFNERLFEIDCSLAIVSVKSATFPFSIVVYGDTSDDPLLDVELRAFVDGVLVDKDAA